MSGLMLVDKPVGLGSRDVGKKIARHLGYRKFGHVGTLDPLATGILIVLLGEATKLSQFLVSADKRYEATIRLGQETDSYDTDGETISTASVSCSEAEIAETLQQFSGVQQQVPPPISAVKIDGVAAHKRVRAGETVELAPREITIHSIEMAQVNLPNIVVRVHCSKGTYLRSLAHDLGQLLGVGGCIAALRRTESPPFHVMHATPLEQILDATPATAQSLLVPLERSLPDWGTVVAPPGSILDQRITTGNLPTATELGSCLPTNTTPGDKLMLVGSQRIGLMEVAMPAQHASGKDTPLRYLRVIQRS